METPSAMSYVLLLFTGAAFTSIDADDEVNSLCSSYSTSPCEFECDWGCWVPGNSFSTGEERQFGVTNEECITTCRDKGFDIANIICYSGFEGCWCQNGASTLAELVEQATDSIYYNCITSYVDTTTTTTTSTAIATSSTSTTSTTIIITTANATDNNIAALQSVSVTTLSITVPIIVVAVIIGLSVYFVRKKLTKYVTTDIDMSNEVPLDRGMQIREMLDRGDWSWHRVEILFEFLADVQSDNKDKYANVNDIKDLESRARAVIIDLYAENFSLQQQAFDNKDFSRASVHSTRLERLSSFVDKDDAIETESTLECVAPGLLLDKHRFEEKSDAFLGHGASASVSKGFLIQGSGDTEVRTEVAVKEIPMAGKGHSNYAMHEFAILTKKLQPLHPNVIRVYDVKSSASANYVIMELCCFSLDEMPQTFKDYLYKYKGSGLGADCHIQQLVINGLVQDILQGTAFLHSKEVAHCDLKPGNVLCAFDRSGKKRTFKSKYFQEAQLKLTDFGVSRIIQRTRKSAGNYTTATVSLDAVKRATGIAGSEGYMSPEVLKLVKAIKSGSSAVDVKLNAETLIGTDSFAAGCVIAYLYSNGKHPFEHGLQNITQNILTGQRRRLNQMGITNKQYISLIEHLTAHKVETRWNPQMCLDRSTLFASESRDHAATILMDSITLRKRPQGSCRDQLEKMQLFKKDAETQMKKMLEQVDGHVTKLMAQTSSLPVRLDEDSLFAIAAYTLDTGKERTTNVYYVLNQVLRARKTDQISFRAWQGFLFFLMRGLDLLKAEERAIVYRGGNQGLDQKTVARDYTIGRPIQWAAFSSTTLSPSGVRLFVRKNEGVIFKITTLTGRNIGPYSFFPKESEVLLSPNARFTVTKSLYKDEAGYSCVDLMETQGAVLNS